MLKNKRVPISVAFELTLGCNMGCIHCGSAAGNIRSKELTAKEWIELSRKLKDLGTQLIVFTGGEPLLRKDWFEIGQNVKDFNLNLSIISNGFLINEKMVTQFRKLDPYAVAISIDGAISKTHDSVRKIKGSFNKCIEVLQLLTKNDIPTTVVTTIHKGNIKELPKLRSMLLDRGIAWQIQLAVPIGRFPKELILSKEEFYSASMFIASHQPECIAKQAHSY